MKKKGNKQGNSQRAEMSEEFWYGDNNPENEQAQDVVDENLDGEDTE